MLRKSVMGFGRCFRCVIRIENSVVMDKDLWLDFIVFLIVVELSILSRVRRKFVWLLLFGLSEI